MIKYNKMKLHLFFASFHSFLVEKAA